MKRIFPDSFSLRNIFIIGLIILLIIWFVYLCIRYQKSSNSDKESKEIESSIAYLPPPNESDHYKWKADSPYTIVNYFSLDCPHCKAIDELEEKNKSKYDTAFTLIYRHSPLSIQPLSGEKAVIAECVFKQSGDTGMFAYVSDAYKHYKTFAKDNIWTLDIARNYVANKDALSKCIDALETKKQVNEQKNKALSYGVYGTPTIGVFKNGELILRLDISGEVPVKGVMDFLAEQVNRGSANQK